MAVPMKAEKALLVAALEGDLEAVRAALECDGADINHYFASFEHDTIDYRDYTALKASAFNARELAREKQHRQLVSYLEAIMKLPEWRNKIDNDTGFTPLTCCIWNNWKEDVDSLMSNFGADVCKMDRYGKTPLIYAIENDSEEIVQLLLENGAIASGVSAFKYALEQRNDDMLKLLINTEGMMLDACFDDGYTLLTKSIAMHNIEIAKCLIEKGVDPSKVDANNSTSLQQALQINSIEIAELLVAHGVNVARSITNSLFLKLAQNENLEVYSFLVKHGWNINQVNDDGKTALCLNAANGFLLVSQFLIENGARVVDFAKVEVDGFRKRNMDFDNFVERFLKEQVPNEEVWSMKETGHE